MEFETKIQLTDFTAAMVIIGVEAFAMSFIDSTSAKLGVGFAVGAIGLYTYYDHVKPKLVKSYAETEIKKCFGNLSDLVGAL